MTVRISSITCVSALLMMCLVLASPQRSSAADDAAETAVKVASTPSQAQAETKTKVMTFSPKNLGSPKTRLGGATRGTNDDVPRTEALVPEEAGQTLKAQPVLYWYLSDKTDHRIDFTLIGLDPINPLLETTLKGGFEPGVQQIRLSDYGIELEEGVSYQWFVAVVPHPDQRLHDRIIGGGLERLSAPSDLQAKLAAASEADAPYILAEAGVWYDALDLLNQQISSSPNDATLLAQRNALLDQVGLGTLN